MKNKYKLQNTILIACATAATIGVIYTNTSLLTKYSSTTSDRERCYGISRASQNDCATAKHSCAAKADTDHDPNEWVMVPKGLCHKIVGGVSD